MNSFSLFSVLFLKTRTSGSWIEQAEAASVLPQNPKMKTADQDLYGDDQKANISKTAS